MDGSITFFFIFEMTLNNLRASTSQKQWKFLQNVSCVVIFCFYICNIVALLNLIMKGKNLFVLYSA